MSGSIQPDELPLIIQALEKPFLPGHRVLALYEDHVVIAVVRGPAEFPEEILSANGHDAWRTFARARRVVVLALDEVECIRTYEGGVGSESDVRLTFSSGKTAPSVLLPGEDGAEVLQYLAEKCPDKLDAKVESAIDVRRKLTRGALIMCLFVNGWVAWAIWEMWTQGTISGPDSLVDFLAAVYEARGFATTAAVGVFGAVCFNLMMYLFSFMTPPDKPRALNCSNCGHRLRGLSSAECPECGTTIRSTIPASGDAEQGEADGEASERL